MSLVMSRIVVDSAAAACAAARLTVVVADWRGMSKWRVKVACVLSSGVTGPRMRHRHSCCNHQLAHFTLTHDGTEFYRVEGRVKVGVPCNRNSERR